MVGWFAGLGIKSNGWWDAERCDVCGCDITQKKERGKDNREVLPHVLELGFHEKPLNARELVNPDLMLVKSLRVLSIKTRSFKIAVHSIITQNKIK